MKKVTIIKIKSISIIHIFLILFAYRYVINILKDLHYLLLTLNTWNSFLFSCCYYCSFLTSVKWTVTLDCNKSDETGNGGQFLPPLKCIIKLKCNKWFLTGISVYTWLFWTSFLPLTYPVWTTSFISKQMNTLLHSAVKESH